MRASFGATASSLGLLVALIMLVWYAATLHMNRDAVERILGEESQTASVSQYAAAAWSLERPVIPAPHQIGAELWKTTAEKRITSKRSLLYHAWLTFAPTALGFLFGMVFGIALSLAIIYSRVVESSALPWVIASQTVPILAIAPMIVVVLGSVGLTGLVPKAIISMYLAFFPITIGMVKGLRSPDRLHMDLMRSYSASAGKVLHKLRLPSSLPFLFASMKVGIAAALVGTIVGELPTGAQGGLGSRLLSGSYYGQTIQIWAALFMAAILGAVLVSAVGIAERIARRYSQPAG